MNENTSLSYILMSVFGASEIWFVENEIQQHLMLLAYPETF
jgi:hypothetical protein